MRYPPSSTQATLLGISRLGPGGDLPVGGGPMKGGSRRELVVGGRMSVIGNYPTSPLLNQRQSPERGHEHAPKGRPPWLKRAEPAFPPPQHLGISKHGVDDIHDLVTNSYQADP